MTACNGEWRLAGYGGGDDDRMVVNRCTGCGDWLVIVGHRGYDVPASVAATPAEAAADVHARLTLKGMT